MATLAILIDGAYLNKVAEDDFGARIDYEKLSEEIHRIISGNFAQPVDLLRTYYFDALPYRSETPSADESRRYAGTARFIDFLRKLPKFQVRLGRLALRGRDDRGRPIFEQKQVDVLLALDIAMLASKRVVTHLAVITGDSDLIPAVSAATEEGASVWLFHGPYQSQVSGYSSELWAAADMRYEIDQEFMNRVERRRR